MKTLHFLRFGIFTLALVTFLNSCKEDDKDDRYLDDGTLSYKLGVGESAQDMLSEKDFKSMVIEIQYPKGYQLPSGLSGDIVDFLNEYCNKSKGIEVVTKELSIPSNNTYTLEQVRSIEDSYRTKFGKNEKLALYLFIAGGDYTDNNGTGRVLGIAHRNTSMVLFQKTIRDNTGGLAQPSEELATNSIFRHELGHLLGLVNIGSNMQTDHEDTSHEHHCNNEDCLMYWSYNSGPDMGNLLGMSSAPDFDASCQADLRANGGK